MLSQRFCFIFTLNFIKIDQNGSRCKVNPRGVTLADSTEQANTTVIDTINIYFFIINTEQYTVSPEKNYKINISGYFIYNNHRK